MFGFIADSYGTGTSYVDKLTHACDQRRMHGRWLWALAVTFGHLSSNYSASEPVSCDLHIAEKIHFLIHRNGYPASTEKHIPRYLSQHCNKRATEMVWSVCST
jgi:hypothetical protein